ncbi:MAG TPA: type II secretion system F family protein [Usitatibacter sp.]|nr:type II secretion system F family protein [Usitatibacter sp.]
MMFRRPPALSLVFKRLALAARTRLPLNDALKIITEDSDADRATVRTLADIAAQVGSGASLSDAMRRHESLFVPETVALVRASEASTAAPVVFGLLAEEFEQRERYRGAIRAALTWPSVSLVVFVILLLVASTMLIPVFADLFKAFAADLPLPTRMLLAFANGAVVWIPLGIVAAWFGWRRFANLRWPDGWNARIPVLRDYLRRVFVARLSLIFLATEQGAPLREMLQHLRATCGSLPLARAVDALQARLDGGAPLVDAVRETPELPARLRVSVELGARSGAFAEAVRQVLDLNAEDTNRSLVRIEQYLLLVAYAAVALLVGFMVIALYLPIFKMGSVL